MKKFYSLFLAIFVAVFTFNPVNATDYAPMGDLPLDPSQSSTLPFFTANGTYTSITQQLYYASEMIAAGAMVGDITALKFYFGNKTGKVREVTRNLEIYIKLVPTSFTEFAVGFTNTDKYTYKFTYPGNAQNIVFDGNYTIPATENNGDKIERTIPTSRFYWDGTSNILVTIIDKTNKKFYSTIEEDYSDSNLKSYGKAPTATASRFVHQYWTEESASSFTTYKNSLDGKFGYCSKNSTTESTERSAHSYVNIIKFTIVPPIPVPVIQDETEVTANSATINWTAATGAESYEVRYGNVSGVYGLKENVGNVISYALDELEDETTYYYQVRTKIGSEYSAWTEEESFTTSAAAPHTHNDITFSKWNAIDALPTAAGSYYLTNSVVLSTEWNVNADINLCLNGQAVYMETKCINIKDGNTLAIYDCEGTGHIAGHYVASLPKYGLINIEDGGTLSLSEGTIQNLYGSYEDSEDPSKSDDKSLSYAIYNNGTLKLSGNPTIESYKADVYLGNSKTITIESGKPLTNSTPYTVDAVGQVITSGWANMSGANPANFFTSAKSGYPAVILDGGEAKLVNAISLSQDDSEETFNSKISGKTNIVITVSLDRSFTSAQYNTVCLPFDLTNTQLEAVFGSGYDLEELTGSSLDGEILNLVFDKVYALEAGKPYLLQPAANVENPTFEGVTITATSAGISETDHVDFQGVYSPTDVGSGENILFVGANNELFWNNNESGELKGFRAFFTANGAAAQAIRARIVKKDNAATAIDNVQGDDIQCKKVLQNGQLLIQHNGTMYNVQGQMVK